MLYTLELAYTALGVIVSLVSLVLISAAYRLALQRQHQGLLSWLLPILIAHGVNSLFWVYVLVFRFLGMRTSLTSVLISFGIGLITGLLDIYAVVRLLSWVRTFLRDQNSAPWNNNPPTPDVWPPPPSPPGT